MSLILDALRKSEAQRRRGEMPDLRAELPPTVHSVAPRRRWPLWFAGIAMAVAVIAVGWGLWERTPKAPPVDAMIEIPNIEAPQGAPAPVTTELPAGPAVVSEPASPARSTSTPGVEPQPVQAIGNDVFPGASAREPTPTATPNASAQARPAPEAPAPANADGRYDEAIANAASAMTPRAAAPSPAAAPAPVAPLPLPTPPPAAGAAVRIADLSPGEREQLPALKISMHMFGPTPTQRFAIIDGARVTQGDRVGEAVVEEIASDGVVLNWHGRRLSLPLR